MSMHGTPPLTVVVTSHNRAELIVSSLESVLASSFREFRLLVLDDASTDGTVEAVRRLAETDSRIRIEVNATNLGQFANRNRAIQLVDTPYLKFHDSDDLMYPHCLEVLMRLIASSPEAGFAMTAGKNWSGGPCPMLLSPRMSYLREFLGQGLFHCSPSGALFRTEVLRELNGFPQQGVGSDFIFWHRACALYPALLAPGDLFWYRIHAGQEMASPEAVADYARAQAHAWRALGEQECPLHGEELQAAKRHCLRRILRLTLRDIKKRRVHSARLRLRDAGVRASDWFRYPPFRIPARPNAGTPLDDRGEFVVPEWFQARRCQTDTRVDVKT